VQDEKFEQPGTDKKTWVAPQVIISAEPIRKTANHFGGGLDGGILVGTSTAS
jgi:hypothetical protein